MLWRFENDQRAREGNIPDQNVNHRKASPATKQVSKTLLLLVEGALPTLETAKYDY